MQTPNCKNCEHYHFDGYYFVCWAQKLAPIVLPGQKPCERYTEREDDFWDKPEREGETQ